MIEKFLEVVRKKEWQGFRVAHHAILPAQEAKYGSLRTPLPDILQEVLFEVGIRKLFSHQAAALEMIRAGSNVVVATPTSSGKSLIYNLAVVEGLLKDPEQRALYLFPIKALSRDQLQTLEGFLGSSPLRRNKKNFRAAVYDGDTPPYERNKIRHNYPHILLTNPDMLHYALLPHHQRWEPYWRRLHYVVVDEMHTYRGIFGSHVAQILWRLQRVCQECGSNPQFILLSATIANPSELAGQLIGNQDRSLGLVEENGAPSAKRHFVFMESEEEGGGNITALAARLLIKAMEAGLKTIAFTQARRTTELLHMSVLRSAPQLGRSVSSYRAGFLPQERRIIEQRLASGELAAVISTSALEMGIDIGGLDLCLLVGYPGTVMTTWQRSGRVGRSGQESAIILIPQPDALDQYISHHPAQFLTSGYEIAVTDPCNEEILKGHLPCAAAELPLKAEEVVRKGEAVSNGVEVLTREGRLLQTADGDCWICPSANPHRQIDIRAVGPSYVILNEREDGESIPIGRNEGIRALKECHPGAVYLHRGESFLVKELDLVRRVIRVEHDSASFFTRVKSEKETEILVVLASKPVGNFLAKLGRLRVTEYITGYEKRRLFTQELLDTNPLDLPPQTFETLGFWIEIEPLLARRIQDARLHFMGGIHAVEHAAISMFPLFALCDRNDIGGISSPLHPQIEKSAIFIYDGYPGGIGLARRGYEIIFELLTKTRELIDSCSCLEGCPGCIHSPKCGSGNKPLDKTAAVTILRYLLGEWDFQRGVNPEHDGTPDKAYDTQEINRQDSSKIKNLRIGFLDLETQRLAQEVGGWQNKHLMKVSVAALFETQTERVTIFKEDEVPDLLKRLTDLDLIVGFNIVDFDYEVLKAYSPVNLTCLPTFDILKEISKVLGYRLSLSHLAEQNLGQAKTSDGIQAVKWFREGNWEQLIEYCVRDVMITRDLFFKALECGHLNFRDRSGKALRVHTPWSLEAMVDRVTQVEKKHVA